MSLWLVLDMTWPQTDVIYEDIYTTFRGVEPDVVFWREEYLDRNQVRTIQTKTKKGKHHGKSEPRTKKNKIKK